MSIVFHTGYGYSKKLCEDITSWFLNEFFPRHKITVEIVHRGLKRENVFGYCDVIGNIYYPREFLIELQTHLPKELYTKTLLHELVHLQQWVNGSLKFRKGKMCYCQEPVENYDYEDQQHEIEAHEQEEILYQLYMNVPASKVAHSTLSMARLPL
jgi:hypothetical protein